MHPGGDPFPAKGHYTKKRSLQHKGHGSLKAQQMADDNHVAGGGDGEKLGQPLDDALPSSPMEATVRLGQSRLDPAASGDGDSSIISEASPSELAGDFGESRHLDTEGDAEPVSSGLPVIGGWPLARQQRALAIAFGLGLAGLLVTAALALAASSRGATQVAAAGQATTQSQRLAKSVSQALAGIATSFPELQESSAVLARNVRSLKTGQGDVPAAPAALQAQLDSLLPFVDRAEKSAAVVTGQQLALTRAREALKAIDRQSVDLLASAEVRQPRT